MVVATPKQHNKPPVNNHNLNATESSQSQLSHYQKATKKLLVTILSVQLATCCFLGLNTVLTAIPQSVGANLRSSETMNHPASISAARDASPTVVTPPANNNNQNNHNTNDPDRWRRLDKYVSKYNYTHPWQSFHGPAPECGQAPNYETFFALPSTEHSRFEEDKIVYTRLFQAMANVQGKKGTYVELGAFNGKTESNSRFFDVCLGWKVINCVVEVLVVVLLHCWILLLHAIYCWMMDAE